MSWGQNKLAHFTSFFNLIYLELNVSTFFAPLSASLIGGFL